MNRAERRRYAKRINTPQRLENFSKNIDREIRKEYEQAYEEKYKKEVDQTIENFIIAIMYCLHFSEMTKLGKKRIHEFMDDLLVTVDMFQKHEYNPEDYRQALEKDGIRISNCSCERKEKNNADNNN